MFPILTFAEADGAAGAPGASGGGDTGSTNLGNGVDASQQDGQTQKGQDNAHKGTEDQSKAGDQAPKKDDKAPVVPEKYELKLPEGVLVDDKLMTKFTEYAKSKGFTNEDAQALADMHLEVVGAFAQKQAEERDTEIMGWHKSLLDDKEIGGANIDATMAQARKVVALANTIPGVDTKRLISDLNKSGLTTHPDLVRIFHFFGKFIGEDNKFITGSSAPGGKRTAEENLYGKAN